MRTRRLLAAVSGVVLVGAGAAVLPLGPAAAAGCPAFFDVNNDGFDDLALGVPGEDLTLTSSLVNAGTVTLIHGDAGGMFGGTGSRLLTQEDLGLVSEAGDRFGAAVATADLNGDGCADLAVGIPGEDAGVGAVVVVWGSANGLDLTQPQLLRQGVSPVGSAAEPGDGFGATLAVAGSLPTGGAAALWVASPREDVGRIADAGLLTEIKAMPGGLLGLAGVTHFHEDTPGVPGKAETGDRFGERLSGGARSLLVGSPREDVGSLRDAGSYAAFMVTPRTWVSFTQNSPGVPGAAEAGDRFGSSVAHAAGCAGATDESWAIGAPGEDLGTLVDAGLVTLRDRLNGRHTTLYQGAVSVPGPAEAGDAFGGSLVDAGVLVVGSPREDVGTDRDSGVVTLIELGCDADGDVVPASARTWSQATAGVAGSSEAGDGFGQSLGASFVGPGGGPLQARLVVGAPGESEGSVQASGNVTIFRTDAFGFTVAGSRAFGQNISGIEGDPEADDGFGGSLDWSNALVL